MKKIVGALAAGFMLGLAAPVHAIPFISFSVTATDTGAPTSFLFSFSTPFLPQLTDGVPVNVLAILDVTVTDGPTGAPASVALAFSFPNLMVNTIGTCNAGVDTGTGFSTPPSPNSQHFQAASTFTPSAGCDDSMASALAFLGSGGGATYNFTATFEINPAQVPEPATLALLGLGLGLGLAGLGIARRKPH